MEITLLNPYPKSPLPWYGNLPTYPVPALARVPAAASLGSVLLARAVRDLKLDVLHDPAGIAPFLAPSFGAGRVVTIHDAIPYVEPRTQPLMTHLIFRLLLPLARITADAVTTCSMHAKDDVVRFMKIPPEKIWVTSSGTDLPSDGELERWRLDAPEVVRRFGVTGPYFLYVGALNPRKNVPRLVEAFGEVHRGHPETRLIVVGPETWLASSALQSTREMGDAVRLTGFVSDEILHVLYAGATAVVFPSIYQGFGLPPLEAMAHGTPAITSSISSMPEVVGDAALLVDPFDVGAIASAMRRVLTDGAIARDLSVRGRARAAHFGWDNVGRNVLDVYRRVVRSA